MNLFSIIGDKIEKRKKAPKEEKFTREEIEERDEVKAFMIEQYENHPLKGIEQSKRAILNAFVLGYHYMDVSTENPNKLTKTPKDPFVRQRSKINNIRRNQNISVAKIMKDEPVLRCVPAGTSINDIKTARIGNAIFDNMYSQNEIDLTGKNYECLKISNTQGTGWFKVKWNPLLAKKLGDYEITVHDDFEIYPDPSATSWYDMEWCIQAYLQDIYKLERIFPKLKGKIKEWHNNQDSQDRNLYTLDFYYNNTKSYQGKALVLEFVSRAGGRYEKGKKAILINYENLAMYGDNPFWKFGYYFSMNFIPVPWDKVPKRLHGTGGVEDQIPINKEINKIDTMTMENIRKTVAVKIGLPRGSAKTQDLFSDRVQHFFFEPGGGGKPEALQIPPMPSYVAGHLAYLTGTQQDMAGIHEVSMGQLPERGSQMSGSALKLLQDSEMVSHSPIMRNLKGALGILGQMILMIVQKYYIEERIITLTGEGKRHEVIKFKNSDLTGSVDVKLQIASAFNTSASAKVEGVTSLYKMGILQDAEKGSKAAKKVLQALEFGQVEEIYQLDSAHEAKAQWVIEQIVGGHTVPDIQPFDNPEIHIRILEEFMLGQDFEEYSDEMKDIFVQRWQQYKAMAQQKPAPDQTGAKPGMDTSLAMPQQAAETNQMLATGSPSMGGPEEPQEVM
ncbi:MAG: hypothetical protein WC455_19935 [Dehalococcoidia bacterium]|jgi:hypothetical protein